MDPPSSDTVGINNANDLAAEALYINQNFRRQVLKRDGQVYKFEHAKVPFEDEESGTPDSAYKYRTWSLGNMKDGTPITLVARTEHDAVQQPSGQGDPLKLTIKAFNEWDSSVGFLRFLTQIMIILAKWRRGMALQAGEPTRHGVGHGSAQQQLQSCKVGVASYSGRFGLHQIWV